MNAHTAPMSVSADIAALRYAVLQVQISPQPRPVAPCAELRTSPDERTHVDDLDELIAATGPGPHDCAVGWWLRSDHPDAVSGRLALVAANLSLPLGVIADRFAARGMKNGRGGPITTQTISRHRDGRCTCPK